jgi:hypothetical protein
VSGRGKKSKLVHDVMSREAARPARWRLSKANRIGVHAHEHEGWSKQYTRNHQSLLWSFFSMLGFFSLFL